MLSQKTAVGEFPGERHPTTVVLDAPWTDGSDVSLIRLEIRCCRKSIPTIDRFREMATADGEVRTDGRTTGERMKRDRSGPSGENA